MKLNIQKPVIVEGKHDKIKLESVIKAKIITTDGFGIFRSGEKAELIRKLADKRGVIVLTDSDGAGLTIRNYINSILPPSKVIHLYIPEIEGKEKRKLSPSKAGLLGVEGIGTETLRALFEPLADSGDARPVRRELTKRDLYEKGLSGAPDSAQRRRELQLSLGLPSNMSANALLAALNLLEIEI